MVRMHIRKGSQGLAALARLVTHPARWVAWSGRRPPGRNSQARPPETGARVCTRVAIETVSRSKRCRQGHRHGAARTLEGTVSTEPIALVASVLEVPAPPGPGESRCGDRLK